MRTQIPAVLALGALLAAPLPLAAQESCNPEPIDTTTAWSEGLIGLLRQGRFDAAAVQMHQYSCVSPDKTRIIADLIQKWKASDDIGYVDLIQDTKLGNTLEKLTCAIRETTSSFCSSSSSATAEASAFTISAPTPSSRRWSPSNAAVERRLPSSSLSSADSQGAPQTLPITHKWHLR
jgi:hypothetical protein